MPVTDHRKGRQSRRSCWTRDAIEVIADSRQQLLLLSVSFRSTTIQNVKKKYYHIHYNAVQNNSRAILIRSGLQFLYYGIVCGRQKYFWLPQQPTNLYHHSDLQRDSCFGGRHLAFIYRCALLVIVRLLFPGVPRGRSDSVGVLSDDDESTSWVDYQLVAQDKVANSKELRTAGWLVSAMDD